MNQIPDKLYFKIGEVSKITGVKPYVLRYWESEFKIVRPQKSASRQRVYNKKDVELIVEIKNLLYNEKFTLEGAKRRLKELHSSNKNSQKAAAGRAGAVAADEKKQLNQPVVNEDYQKALMSIKEELHTIRKILQNGA